MPVFTFDNDDVQLPTVEPPTPVTATYEDDVFSTDKMDLDVPKPALHIGTPPINIISPISKRPSMSQLQTKQPGPEKLDFEMVFKKAQKNKKKKKKAMKGAMSGAVATNIARGFHTPVTSGGEESDFSLAATPRFGPAVSGLPSVTSSPLLRPIPSMGGISSLKAQLESLNIGPREDSPLKSVPMSRVTSGLSSNTSTSGFSESDRTEMDTYEVDLIEDFSMDAVSKNSTMLTSGYARKMTAEDFEPLMCLGKGSYGTVLLVRQRGTGRLFAQKQFKKASITVHKKLIEQTKTERNILESVNRHPFIVNLYYAFQDHEKLYLILEYAQGGELFHHLAAERMFSEEVAAFYMAEMVLALDHLHRTVGVIYRDLKPENCLLDAEGHLLLTDFGLSKVSLEDDPCKSFLGTIEYMAPEVIQGVEYGAAVDWWSLGALGFDLLTGAPPFTGNNNAKIQEKILKSKLSLPYYLSPDAKDLLTRLLRKEPKKRLGSNMPKDMQTIKNHRFFRRINWKKLEARELESPIIPLITEPELAENFAQDFTDLPLSPVLTKKSFDDFISDTPTNPFGGFSFVASESLLEGGEWGF